MSKSSPFTGLCAFPLTPADSQGRVDIKILSRLVERLCDAGVDSIGLLGSTGTYAYLSREERRRAIDAAVECIGGRVPLVVGIGALRTDHAQDLARDAETAGANALLLAPVSYTPLTQNEVYQHYRSVTEVAGLPLCIYNNPGTTHFTFNNDLLERLAALPTVKAVKMPLPADGNFAGEIAVLRSRTSMSLGYSSDWGMADALLAGADAFYSVLGGLMPNPIMALARAAQAGDADQVSKANAELRPLWETFKAFGSLRVMYVLLDLLGLGTFEPPRPILPLDSVDRDQVLAAADILLRE